MKRRYRSRVRPGCSVEPRCPTRILFCALAAALAGSTAEKEAPLSPRCAPRAHIAPRAQTYHCGAKRAPTHSRRARHQRTRATNVQKGTGVPLGQPGQSLALQAGMVTHRIRRARSAQARSLLKLHFWHPEGSWAGPGGRSPREKKEKGRYDRSQDIIHICV